MRYAGYNGWAEANGIVVLHPQAYEDAVLEQDGNYVADSDRYDAPSVQLVVVNAMVDAVGGKPSLPHRILCRLLKPLRPRRRRRVRPRASDAARAAFPTVVGRATAVVLTTGVEAVRRDGYAPTAAATMPARASLVVVNAVDAVAEAEDGDLRALRQGLLPTRSGPHLWAAAAGVRTYLGNV